MGKHQKKSAVPTLDLHGLTVDEVFDRMDRFLRKEEAAGTAVVRVLHGRGTGKVKEKALDYCRQTGHSPRPDKGENGQVNPGSFLLSL